MEFKGFLSSCCATVRFRINRNIMEFKVSGGIKAPDTKGELIET